MRKIIGVWREKISSKANDTTHTFYSEYVSEGEMWYLHRFALMNLTTADSTCIVYIDAVTHLHPIGYYSLIGNNIPYFVIPECWLREGERLRFDWTGVAADEVLQAFLTGIKASEIAG
jgi:hypothetical protein